jgi:hypothetical protein
MSPMIGDSEQRYLHSLNAIALSRIGGEDNDSVLVSNRDLMGISKSGNINLTWLPGIRQPNCLAFLAQQGNL